MIFKWYNYNIVLISDIVHFEALQYSIAYGNMLLDRYNTEQCWLERMFSLAISSRLRVTIWPSAQETSLFEFIILWAVAVCMLILNLNRNTVNTISSPSIESNILHSVVNYNTLYRVQRHIVRNQQTQFFKVTVYFLL